MLAQAPLRHLVTPGGFRMSVAMSNCGALGWVTDRSGYRYDATDPDSGRPWPAMPAAFRELAAAAARAGGFEGFAPDACLINRYEAGTRLSLHQDRDEGDYDWPDRLGLAGPAGRVPVRRAEARGQGAARAARAWRRGGVGRAGAAALPRRAAGEGGRASADGSCRINLTFRKAG